MPAAWRSPLSAALVFAVAWMMFVVGRENPPSPFWDENYYLTSSERYVQRRGNFEGHPPLGKLLIAAGEVLSGANDHVDKTYLARTTSISGDEIPKGFSYAGMRLFPSVFAAMTAVLFFGLLLRLLKDHLLALLFSTLYLFENAWIVHFRATHLDSFQMFFVVGALWYLVTLWQQTRGLRAWEYAVLGTLCGLAIMVKVNAALLLAAFVPLYFRDRQTRALGWRLWPQLLAFTTKSVSAAMAVLVVCFAVFSAHVLVANKPVRGPIMEQQYGPFMSAEYRDYLAGKRGFSPAIVLHAAWDDYRFMQNEHLGVPKLDICKPGENGSAPTDWPFGHQTISYRWDMDNGATSYVHLVGNRLSWTLALAALVLAAVVVINRRALGIRRFDEEQVRLIELFLGLYALFMALHVVLASKRVMYLYHYFMGLMLSYVLLVLCFEGLAGLWHWSRRVKMAVAVGLTLCVVASGVFFLPLSNHWPLTKEQCERRNWFGHVIRCQG